MNLRTSVALLRTPLSTDGTKDGPNQRDGSGGEMLSGQVHRLGNPGDWISETGKDYGPAVRRWESVTGNPIPPPTEPGPRTAKRLSARFAEWMMGLPAGWVTDTPGVDRKEQLRCIGNGVVPQQAQAAFEYLLATWPDEPEENTMADQPDIVVTDSGAPAGHLNISVDGHQQVVPQEEAKQFIADAVSDAQ